MEPKDSSEEPASGPELKPGKSIHIPFVYDPS
jgi:hypothetical protein